MLKSQTMGLLAETKQRLAETAPYKYFIFQFAPALPTALHFIDFVLSLSAEQHYG